MLNNFDSIVLSRRTCRSFTADVPTKEQITSILKAGLHAPYAALALKDGQKLRQFVVVNGTGKKIKEIRNLVQKHIRKLEKIIPIINFLFPGKISKVFAERIKQNLLGNAPYYIFVIEPKGFPPASQQSISHCLENMWLKATEIDLGFRVISVFESMNKNIKLLNLLSLGKGPYSINCCCLGYPAYQQEESRRPNLEENTIWLD